MLNNNDWWAEPSNEPIEINLKPILNTVENNKDYDSLSVREKLENLKNSSKAILFSLKNDTQKIDSVLGTKNIY